MSLAREDGFSLIEMIVVMFLMAILGTISLTSFRSYNRAQDHKGAVREAVALLRNAQVRSVSEAVTYQVVFTSDSLKVYRDSPAVPPSSSRLVKTYLLTESRFASNLRFLAASPDGCVQSGGGSVLPNCFFYPRGSSTPGTIKVQRIDSGRIFTLSIDGLTGRVSYDL